MIRFTTLLGYWFTLVRYGSNQKLFWDLLSRESQKYQGDPSWDFYLENQLVGIEYDPQQQCWDFDYSFWFDE